MDNELAVSRLSKLTITCIVILAFIAIGTVFTDGALTEGGGAAPGSGQLPPDNGGTGSLPQPPTGSGQLPPGLVTNGNIPVPPAGINQLPPDNGGSGSIPQPPGGTGQFQPGIGGGMGQGFGKDDSDNSKMNADQAISFLFPGNVTIEPILLNKPLLNSQESEPFIINLQNISSSNDQTLWLILPVKPTGSKPDVNFAGMTQRTIQSGDKTGYRIYNLSAIHSSQNWNDVTIANTGEEQLEIPVVYLLSMVTDSSKTPSEISISDWKEEGKFSTATIPSFQNETEITNMDTEIMLPLRGDVKQSPDNIEIANGGSQWTFENEKPSHVLILNGSFSDEEEQAFITFESKLKEIFPVLLLVVRSEKNNESATPEVSPSSNTTLPAPVYKQGKDLQLEKTADVLRKKYISSLGFISNLSQISGYAYIESYPSGETISFDGKTEQKGTPLFIGPISQGRYLVKDLTHDPEEVIITPGRISFYKFNSFTPDLNDELVNELTSKRLENKTKSANPLRIESIPDGAEIIIDDSFTGMHTPAEFWNLSIGTHTITLMIPGYFPARKEVIMPIEYPDGTKHLVNLTLKPLITGGLTVTSNPVGAKIYLNGRFTGETTPCTFPFLKIGLYLLTLKSGSDKKSSDILINPYEIRNYSGSFIKKNN